MSNLILSTIVGLVSLHGALTYYDEGVFPEVVRNRLAYGQVEPCPECVGFIAVRDCEHLGDHAYLRVPGRDTIGPLLIVDCAAQQHRAGMTKRGRIAEVEPWLARELGMWHVGPLYDADLYILDPHL